MLHNIYKGEDLVDLVFFLARTRMIYMHVSPTYDSQAVRIGTLGTDDAPETLLLQGTVRLVEMSLAITVHHTPLTVQHAKTITETGRRIYRSV